MIAAQIGRALQRTHQRGQVPRQPGLPLIPGRVNGARVVSHGKSLSPSPASTDGSQPGSKAGLLKAII